MTPQYEQMLKWTRKRRARILALHGRGWSFTKIAAEMKISRQRVHQILKGAA